MRYSKSRRFRPIGQIILAALTLAAFDCAAEGVGEERPPDRPAFIEPSQNAIGSEAEPRTALNEPVLVSGNAGVISGAAAATGGPRIEADSQISNPTNAAMTAAVADGVTTGLALSAGAIEANPLIMTSPVGLVALTGAKIGLVKYADTLPQEDKRVVMKTSSAVWGGAAVNNLFVLMAAPPPFPIIAGLIMGLATWQHMEGQYQKEDELIAAREGKLVASVAAPPASVPEVVDTSGY